MTEHASSPDDFYKKEHLPMHNDLCFKVTKFADTELNIRRTVGEKAQKG